MSMKIVVFCRVTLQCYDTRRISYDRSVPPQEQSGRPGSLACNVFASTVRARPSRAGVGRSRDCLDKRVSSEGIEGHLFLSGNTLPPTSPSRSLRHMCPCTADRSRWVLFSSIMPRQSNLLLYTPISPTYRGMNSCAT